MLASKDFEDGVVLGGDEGKGAKVSDVRPNTIGKFDVLEFYVKVNSRLKTKSVDDGFEHLEADEVTVKLWIPQGDDAKAEKKIKSNNSMLTKLSGEFIAADDEQAWMDALPGGKYYDAITTTAEVHVRSNHFNGNNEWQFEFNAAKPKRKTKDEFVADYVKRKGASTAEEVAY